MSDVETKNTPDAVGEKSQGYTWDALRIIAGVTSIAILASVIYGGLYSYKGAVLAFLASLLGFAVGGLAGFLFGFPRYTEGAAVAGIEDLRNAIAAQGTGAIQQGRVPQNLRPNTNLERIVDWLMTMIVGATLVNLKELVSWSTEQFQSLSAAVTHLESAASNVSSNLGATPGALLVLPFMVAGFLQLYLWARRFLPAEWTAAEHDLNAVIGQFEERQRNVEKTVNKLKTRAFTVALGHLRSAAENLNSIGVDRVTIEDILTRYRSAKTWDDEPFAGFGESKTAGFRMSASVQDDGSDNPDNPYKVILKIDREDGTPIRGAVVFLMHNTFDEPVLVRLQVNASEVEETLWIADAFIVGALVIADVEGQPRTTRLALDLAKIPGVPTSFVSSGQ